MRFAYYLVFLAGLSCVTWSVRAQAEVVSPIINEIHYDEADKTEFAEFIEIYNPTEAAINLEG